MCELLVKLMSSPLNPSTPTLNHRDNLKLDRDDVANRRLG